jgi:uncharacterized protein YdhG (YjbR/CyaY superfamily)
MKSTHYKNIDHYIASQPVEIRPTLERLRHTIQKAVPKAEEVISYQMPAFRYHGMLIFFASFKKHYSIFVPTVLHLFKNELKIYKTSKATVNFPLDTPVQTKLITKIVKCAAKHNLEKAKLKLKKKKI